MTTVAFPDLQPLANAIQVLCTPFAYACSSTWRTEAHRAVADVVGPALAGFVLPNAEELLLARDRVGTEAAPAASSPVGAASDAPPTVVHDAQYRVLLESLVPAFRAGVSMVIQMQQARYGLVRQLEASDAPAVLFAGDRREIHRTAALTRLGSERHVDELVECMGDLATRLRDELHHPPGRGFHGSVVVVVEGVEYTLIPTLHPDLLVWGGAGVAVVARRNVAAPSDAVLRARYGLTAREVQVARALASSASIEDIALQLDVSVHTVRRHSEQVHRKLGVNSRRAVADRLASRGAEPEQ